MSPDAAVTQLDGARSLPATNRCCSLPQFPMLPQHPALGTVFLIGLLQAMAEKGMMGIESVALCEDDYGEGAESIAATAANVISGGSGGTLSGAAASEDAMVAPRLHHAAASCTCTVHVRPSRALMSHSLPAAPLLLAQPALCHGGSPLMTPTASSEQLAAGRRNALRGGGHVPSELLSELLPFHIAVDSDGMILQVCQCSASNNASMHASKHPGMRGPDSLPACFQPLLAHPSFRPPLCVCMQAGSLLSQWVFQGAAMRGRRVSDFFKASLMLSLSQHPPATLLCVLSTSPIYSCISPPPPLQAGGLRQPLAQLCAACCEHCPQ